MQKRGSLTHYDRKCLHLPHDEVTDNLHRGLPFTLRLKVPEGSTKFEDLVHGPIEFNNNQIDDQILLKSDNLPTYHLANVVDDHHMKVTHVMRGDVCLFAISCISDDPTNHNCLFCFVCLFFYTKKEWLSSTPKHVILYNTFGWKAPTFAHLPLLLNEDRTKLSKRHGNTDAAQYKEAGYLPEALLNFIAFLGWNPKTTREVFSLADLASEFSVENLNKAGSVVVKAKLDWFNKEHLHMMAQDPQQLKILAGNLRTLLEQKFQGSQLLRPEVLGDDYLSRVILATKERIHLIREIADSFSFFFVPLDRTGEAYRQFQAKLNKDLVGE